MGQNIANFKGATVADFFAGIGLVSMGLERAGWKTVYALDYDKDKAAAYNHHFGAGHYHINDIAKIHGRDVPSVTLAHASFPCTDLSIAGARGGIRKGESSSFWHFPRILTEMREYPPFVLLENVEGYSPQARETAMTCVRYSKSSTTSATTWTCSG